MNNRTTVRHSKVANFIFHTVQQKFGFIFHHGKEYLSLYRCFKIIPIDSVLVSPFGRNLSVFAIVRASCKGDPLRG